MMNTLEHKGYYGSAEVDTEGNALVGKLLYIRDTIAYSASDLAGLKAAFVEAVEDYLTTCQALGDEPDVPCKGVFNVRVGAERHLAAALEARRRGVSLNELVTLALDGFLMPKTSHTTVNNYDRVTLVVTTQNVDKVMVPSMSHTAGASTHAIAH